MGDACVAPRAAQVSAVRPTRCPDRPVLESQAAVGDCERVLEGGLGGRWGPGPPPWSCLLYTSDAADDTPC
eukprot:2834815-Pyramimonas_sp.AAC.1